MLQHFTKLPFWATERPPREDRLEIKFVLPGRMLSDVRLRVLLHPLGFVSAYPSRQVNNIYFDSPDFDAFEMHKAGIAQRVKVRIRWYGEIEQMLQPVLELKVKSGMAGRKFQYPLDSDFDLSTTRWSSLTRAVLRALPPDKLQYIGFTSSPVLLNSYQREYYATRDGAIRATIDQRVQSFDQRFTAKANWRLPDLGTDLVVVEFKAGVAHEATLRRATSAFGWRVSRNSKYVRGLAPDYL